MKPDLVDANVFIRLITKDDVKKAKRCFKLFEMARKNKASLSTSESVLSEVVYILSSKKLYNLDRKKVKTLLEPLINLRGLKIEFKAEFLLALRIFAEQNIDFEDALSAAYVKTKKFGKIYSYDKDFDKIKGVLRVEP